MIPWSINHSDDWETPGMADLEDWSDALDDQDSAYWEDHYSHAEPRERIGCDEKDAW